MEKACSTPSVQFLIGLWFWNTQNQNEYTNPLLKYFKAKYNRENKLLENSLQEDNLYSCIVCFRYSIKIHLVQGSLAGLMARACDSWYQGHKSKSHNGHRAYHFKKKKKSAAACTVLPSAHLMTDWCSSSGSQPRYHLSQELCPGGSDPVRFSLPSQQLPQSLCLRIGWLLPTTELSPTLKLSSLPNQ